MLSPEYITGRKQVHVSIPGGESCNTNSANTYKTGIATL